MRLWLPSSNIPCNLQPATSLNHNNSPPATITLKHHKKCNPTEIQTRNPNTALYYYYPENNKAVQKSTVNRNSKVHSKCKWKYSGNTVARSSQGGAPKLTEVSSKFLPSISSSTFNMLICSLSHLSISNLHVCQLVTVISLLTDSISLLSIFPLLSPFFFLRYTFPISGPHSTLLTENTGKNNQIYLIAIHNQN